MRKNIKKQWDALKVYLHSLPENKGKELEHINGREGCFLACKLLIVPLTKKQHEQEHRDYRIFKENIELIRKIREVWNKYYGCMKIQDKKCLTCPLLNTEIKQLHEKKDCVFTYDYTHNGYETECDNFFHEAAAPCVYVKYCCFCGKTIIWSPIGKKIE